MRVDIYYTTKSAFFYTRMVRDVMLDVLCLWTESRGHRARVRVCGEGGIRYHTGAQVVVFCVYTYNARAVYRASMEMRRRGKIVILGGPHFKGEATIREGARHGDVVVHSVCREQWEDLLDKIEGGALAPGARESLVVRDTGGRFTFPDGMEDLYRRKSRLQFPLVFTSIGCPYQCEFCTPTLPGRYVMRPVEDVVREISGIRNRTVVIADASFGVDARHLASLMEATSSLGKKFWAETTVGMLDRDGTVEAFVKGGGGWIAVGIEGLSAGLRKHGRMSEGDRRAGMLRAIARATDRGIAVQANFMCGLDTDTEESIDAIYDLFMESTIGGIYIDLVVPYPNSRLHERMAAEGRVFDTAWERYDYEHVVFHPRGMTARRLMEKYIEVYAKVTRPGVLFRKTRMMFRHTGFSRGFFFMTLWNLARTMEAPWRLRRLRKNLARLDTPALALNGAAPREGAPEAAR
jgi:radical SAM superfamily enzyme YgiQ (UPF0313 family)